MFNIKGKNKITYRLKIILQAIYLLNNINISLNIFSSKSIKVRYFHPAYVNICEKIIDFCENVCKTIEEKYPKETSCKYKC